MQAGIPKQLKLSTLVPLVVNSLFLFPSSFCLWTIKARINVHDSKQATTYSLLKLELNKIYYRITTYGCNDQFPNIQFPSSVIVIMRTIYLDCRLGMNEEWTVQTQHKHSSNV